MLAALLVPVSYAEDSSGKMDPVIYGLSSKTTSYWPGLRIPLNCTTDEGAAFTYTIKESSREGAIEIDEDGIVTVHKAGYFTITATAAPTAHYNGGSRDIEVNVSKCGIDSITDIDAVTTAVYNPDGISFPVNSVTLKDMRSNTLIFTPTDTAGYDAVPVKVDVTIAKKAVTVTGRTLTVRVGKKASVLTGSEFTVDGLVGGDELTTLPTLRYETVPDTSAAGEVAIVLTGADAGSNYSVSTVNGKLVIVPAVSGDDAASAENRITPAETSNGTVTAMPSAAAAGDTVTITVVPEAGYTLETLTVKDAKGSEIELRSKENGICTFIMPDSPVSVEATFMEDNTMLNCFVDIPAGAYYYDAVLWAAQNRITGGVDAVRFSPGAACTRAQIVTFLARFAGGTASSAVRFSDVPADAYYAGAAAWAAENHITDGIAAINSRLMPPAPARKS